MAAVQGNVTFVTVTDTLGLVKLSSGDNFVLWWDLFNQYTPPERLKHSMWVSLLEQAMVSDKTVRIDFPNESSMVPTAIRLQAMPMPIFPDIIA